MANAACWKPRNLHRQLTAEDLRVTDDRFGVTLALWRCRNCGFIFAVEDELSELAFLYEGLSDVGYEQSQEARRRQMRWLLTRTLETCPEARSVLDIGAGLGLLVQEAKRLDLQAVGVEPSRSFVNRAAEVHGVVLHQGFFPHPCLAGQRFDVVFLVDVIEHVSEPVTLLQRCREALQPHGLVVVVTPDVGSLPARILRRRWWHFRLAHVGYFNGATLLQACDAAGLSLLARQRARWFFELAYLLERLANYAPVGGIVRLAKRWRPLGRLCEGVVRVNLHDSWVFFLKRAGNGSS